MYKVIEAKGGLGLLPMTSAPGFESTLLFWFSSLTVICSAAVALNQNYANNFLELL